MSDMAINWVNIYKQFRGKWIALERDEKTVVASGKHPKIVIEKAQKNGTANPILSYVPPEVSPMVG